MKLNGSIALLLAANVLPVFGVVFWDWDVFTMLFLFWCENVVIGLFGVLRVWVYAARTREFGGFFLGGFFLLHYGGFMFGHLMMLVSLFAGDSDSGTAAAGAMQIFSEYFDKWILIGVLGLFISHGWSFADNFIGREEYRSLTGTKAMSMPYKRMAITHVALMVGGVLLVGLDEPLVGLLVLLGMKITLDVVFHRREHEQSAHAVQN